MNRIVVKDHADVIAGLNVVARLEKLPVPDMMDETHDAMLRKLFMPVPLKPQIHSVRHIGDTIDAEI